MFRDVSETFDILTDQRTGQVNLQLINGTDVSLAKPVEISEGATNEYHRLTTCRDIPLPLCLP